MPAAFPIIATALASFAMAYVLVLTAARHGRFTMDLPGAIQKSHLRPTPRIGGVGIYIALLAALPWAHQRGFAPILTNLLVAGIPALLVGLAEDVTKAVRPATRLLATAVSGVLACWLSGLSITHVDVPVIDRILAFHPASLLFTAVAVAGVANAVNIIDGFNGLASGTATLALCCIAALASTVGDTLVMTSAITLAAALVGFWLVNFPWGKLFLGDGGAYFAGFALAWLAVLLPMRNPSVSPWASLLICGYPVIEVLYSVVRRLRSGRSPGDPDGAHLHSLVASRVVNRRLRRVDPTLRNSAVSVLMWLCAAFPALLGVTFHAHTSWLVASALGCALLYHWLYSQLARS